MRAMARVSPAEPDRRGLRVPGARDHDPTSSRGTVDSWRSSGTRGSHKRARTMLLSRVDLGKVEKHNLSWRERWYGSSVAASCRKGIRSRAFSCVAIVCLFCALFLYDTCVLLQVPSNVELDVVLTLVLLVFLSEFLGLALTESTYPGGFFFWMDLIGSLSMLFDISFLLGTDATRPEEWSETSAKDNVILVRAARVARLGARAGRLTRVVKILRFMPFLYTQEGDDGNVKVAHSITGRLNSGLAKRVAFLTISIVVTMPIFNMFQYPESDHSFTSWAKLLDRSVKEVLASPGSSEKSELRNSEFRRFSEFYQDLNYGPYEVCYRVPVGDGFDCQALTLSSSFERPRRRASIREVRESDFDAFFDMSVVKAQESAASMATIVLIVVVMLSFGLLMSNSISAIALAPLERMLSVVREHCKQIFKFAAGIQEDILPEDEENDDVNEFLLLEAVITKLSGIASLSTKRSEPQVTKDMREEDIIKLNWMHGSARPKASQIGSVIGSDEGTPNAIRLQRSLFSVRVSAGGSSGAPSSGTLSRNRTVSNMSRARTLSLKDRTLSAQPRGTMLLSPTWAASVVSMDDETWEDGLSENVVGSLDSAHCNVLVWDKEVQLGVCEYIFTTHASCADWVTVNVESQTLNKFISAVQQGYPENPFHNFAHGVDVLCSVSRFLHLIEAGGFLTEVSQYLLLIAALGHDVGHLGVSNQFLIDTSHELALKYNDRSPMEMMHCSKLFHITKDPSCDIFRGTENDLYKDIRKVIIDGILHTDMVHHFSMVKELGIFYEVNSESFDRCSPGSVVNESPQSVQTVLNALLHCADISNPMKPWELCHRYADMVFEEFFAQGDQERELGIPVQFLNDREKVNRPISQIGFIEFVVAPMCEACVHLFPALNDLADHLGKNTSRWGEVWQAESSPEQAEVDKVHARVQRVLLRCTALAGARRAIASGMPRSPPSSP